MMPSQPALVGPAPVVGLPEPTVAVTNETTAGTERTVNLAVDAGRPMSSLDVEVNSTQPIARLTMDGRRVTPTNDQASGTFRVLYITGEKSSGFSLAVTVPQAAQVTLHVDQRSSGLPQIPDFTVSPHPAWMTHAPAFEADPTIVIKTVSVPGR